MALHAITNPYPTPNPNPNPNPISSMQCHGRMGLMHRINVWNTNTLPEYRSLALAHFSCLFIFLLPCLRRWVWQRQGRGTCALKT